MNKVIFPLLAGALISAHRTDLNDALSTSLLTAHSVALDAAEADANNGVWLQLVPAGSFKGRDGRGPFVAGDQASLERIAAHTRAYMGATDILVDYEHQSLYSQQNGKPVPAAGWVKELSVRPDGLYGRVEWTASAASAIKGKEYRYLSPVFFHTKEGQILALQTVALTNTPNLSVLAEASAHSFFQPQHQEDNMKKLLAALGLADGASEDDALIAINSLLTSSTAIAVAAGLTKDAKSEEILASINSAFSDRRAIAKAAGQADTASGDILVNAVTSAMKAGSPNPTKFVPIEQVSAMQADIKALQERLNEDKATEAVDAAIRAGKLAPALKDWALSMHKADPAAFEAFVDKAPVLTSAQRSATAVPPGKDRQTLGEPDEAVISAMGISREAYAKTLADEAKGGN